jgi:lysylphosphatidylglycerol synthetase-like protein (DUF2156 family)
MERVLELLRAHGVNATSFQTLEPGLEHWFTERGDGCVAYVDTGRAWVALGEPIATADRIGEVIDEFVAASMDAGRRPRLFGVEAPVDGLGNLAIGEQPLWRPAGWPETLAGVRSLREQLRRARAKGVAVSEIANVDLDEPRRAAIATLADEWKASRTLAPMRFAVTLDLFGNAAEKRYFVAERDGVIVGALIAVPIYARGGWLLEDLLRGAAAPNGTAELLIDAAMRALAAGGAEVVTMGLAPLSGIESRALAAIARRGRWLFDFEGLRAFKAKLRPARWQPVYVAYPERERGVAAVLDVLRCFASGPLWRFGLRTLLHRRRAVVWLLAVLLIPWTALLATPAAARFFPSDEIQVGWLIVDGALFCGLAALAHRWRRPLATLMAAAAACDLVAGAYFAATYNVGRAAGLDWLAIGLSLAAPLAASVFLGIAAARTPVVSGN